MTRLTLATIALSLAAAPLTPIAAQTLLWARQAGTGADDLGAGVAVDAAGDAYVIGSTSGSLVGPNAGGNDVFLSKRDASGALLWARQFGTSVSDSGQGVAVDAEGNVYTTGWTLGSLAGTSFGGADAFLTKHDATGTMLWTRQIGTSAPDIAYGVAVDGAGNVYISGSTYGGLGGTGAGDSDAFLVKFDASGGLLWKRQIGTAAYDESVSVAVDSAGNVYLAGATQGSLSGANAGGFDIFLTKWDASGTVLWTRQVGTAANERASGVAVDLAGNSFVTGFTAGSLGGLNAGANDIVLLKCDASGSVLWTRQVGTAKGDSASAVATDSAGNLYVAGYTEGPLGGPVAGLQDAFLSKYNASGTVVWTFQTGTAARDVGLAVAVDSTGFLYLAGYTGGGLSGSSAGGYDVFLDKFGSSLCPADFNHDGFVTGDDFDSFSLAFIAGDAAADFDHNGFVTGDDFDAYVAAFEAGC